ncbi:MAG TPA: YfiR family protein, partial [Oligoflexia bacterium]|nr:YfiR family protein [Oligoflexia bacterium]
MKKRPRTARPAHAVCHQRKLCVVLLLSLALRVVFRPAVLPADDRAREYQVKAAYLLNFTKYVYWPEGSFSAQDSPFVVCVLNGGDFFQQLEATLRGKTTRGRQIIARSLTPDNDHENCHILYIPADAEQLSSSLLVRSHAHPVLTVGESPYFAGHGGCVALRMLHDTVQFDVNINAASAAGLRISPQMLTLAH